MVAELKLVVMGTGAVGKSCVTLQFVQGLFVAKYDPTIEDAYRKAVDVDGQAVVLDILDTAGTDMFTQMRDLYLREGQGFVLMYSVTSKASWDELGEMRETLMRARDGERVPVALAGNKCDLAEQRTVSSESGAARAEEWGAAFHEVSAKTGAGVDAMFMGLVREILARRAKQQLAEAAGGKKQRRVAAACTLL
jgi:small GTP-binding protein